MYAQHPTHPAGKGSEGAVGLVVVHVVLVLFTVLLNLALLVTSDPHDQCRIHNVRCDRGAHLREAALISLVGTAVLIALEIALTAYAHLRKGRRLPFVVPLLCCFGQFAVLCAAFALGSTGIG